jgi:hypothetical protein
MFAVSQVDSNKLGRFAESMNNAFLEGGIFSSARGTPVAQGGGGGSAIVQQIVGDRPSFMQYKSPSLQAEVLRDAVAQVLEQGGLKDIATLRYDPRGVVLSVPEGALFAPDSADLSPAAKDKLDTLALAVGEAPDRSRSRPAWRSRASPTASAPRLGTSAPCAPRAWPSTCAASPAGAGALQQRDLRRALALKSAGPRTPLRRWGASS